jgi:glycosyltransferase involved in cell wall biosynthesis
MNVLHVIPALAARYGGPSRAVVGMCRALEERGVRTLVAATDADGPGRLPVRAGEVTLHEGVPAVVFTRAWNEAFKYSRSLGRWLDAHVEDFDVVHVHAVFSHASLAAGRACRRRGVPYVVRPLGSLDPWSLGRKRWRKRLLWQLGARRLLEDAAAIHYTTAEEQRLAEAALGLGRGVVIPLGVDGELLEARVEAGTFRRRWPALGDAPYLLSMARLDPKKGLEALIEAFAALGAEDALRAWRLVIAGDGDPGFVARLRRFAERRAPAGRVIFTGWLGGPDRLAAYRDAAVVVLPSWQENFALSAAEALASGVPVVLGEGVNLAPEVRAAGAGWVTRPEPGALREVLRLALADDDERRVRGARGRRLVRERFTWPAVAAALEGLYASVARDGARVGVP